MTRQMNSQNNNNPSYQAPLITVSGGLSDFLLEGHLCKQINSDLARESIDWQRNCYDITPVPVYVEAYFVRLDDRRHLLWDFGTKDNKHVACQMPATTPKQNPSNVVDTPIIQTANAATSRIRQLNVSTLKRHRSFNISKRSSSPYQSNNLATSSNIWSTSPQTRINRSESSSSGSHQNRNSNCISPIKQRQQPTINYLQLFRMISKRYLVNNGSRVLLNSYWLDSNYDLENYNSQVRDHLLDWFQKILQTTAYQQHLGLNQDFNMDFFIVIVVRNHMSSSGSTSHDMLKSQNHTKNRHEQLLNLNSLLNETNFSSMITSTSNSKKNSKSTIKSGSSMKQGNLIHTRQTQHQLSSSMTSLNTAINNNTTGHVGPTHLTHQQLADQIRNDLLVCFQLFRQNHFTDGTFTNVEIPPNNSRVATQLLERVIIFDSTSNSSCFGSQNASSSNILPSLTANSNVNSSHNLITSTNPIISSTARTFSALSNFSASSIKITPSSMISTMSPTRSSSSRLSKTSLLMSGPSSSSSSSSSSSLTGSSASMLQSSATPVLNYSQFIIRIRAFLLEFYTKQFDCFEKLIRHIRELRTDLNWDFFGFFLLQEELAFTYESLGLYSKALIQYDELDALFSQLILNASYHGGFNAPRWLKYHFMQMIDDSVIKNGSISSNNRPEAWTGLCLCNQESIMSLRMSIVKSVLAYDNVCLKDLNQYNESRVQQYDSEPSRSTVMSSSGHLPSSSNNFDDPLGVMIGITHNPYGDNNIGEDSDCGQFFTSYHISLLDFRNYLYARQCHLLCLLNKPWELASRALPFLQTSVAELNMLEISIAPGGIACWVFLSVLEILHKCERYSDSSQLDSYSYHTVGLWSYARDNLIELGKICNLMPDGLNKFDLESYHFDGIKSKSNDSSEHLHQMVELVAGMGTDPHIRPSNSSQQYDNWMSPQERLKDALSSPESFLRHYLEITELTMGTYKHIGYIRCARSIGKQLAEFNLKLNKPQQALPFLLDLYHMFQTEHWTMLKKQACRLLAQCLEQLYFNISNTLCEPGNTISSVSDTNNFSLEPIIRSAFHTYLMLLSKHEKSTNVDPNNCNDLNAKKSKIYNQDSMNIQEYLNSMFRLVRHYKMRGVKLKDMLKDDERLMNDQTEIVDSLWLESPLLVVHNSHSDLFHDGSSMSATLSSCSETNSNSSSNSNINNNVDSMENRQVSTNQRELASIKNQSNEQLNNQCRGNCGATRNRQTPNITNVNYNRSNFLRIESLEMTCDSSLIDGPEISANKDNAGNIFRKDHQSFIAGSVLKLKLKIHSNLELKLKLDRILVTLQCHLNDPGMSSNQQHMLSTQKSSNESVPSTIIQQRQNEPLQCSCICTESSLQLNQQNHSTSSLERFPPGSCCMLPDAQMESYYCQTLQSAGVKCLNENHLLKRSNLIGCRNGSFDGYHKFISQSFPISLLNQRLSIEDYYKFFRFLSSSFKFESSFSNTIQNSKDGDLLMMETGPNQYELLFHSPENLYSIVKDLNFLSNNDQTKIMAKSNVSTNINHVWFNLDQLILFCQYEHEPKSESIQFAIVEDFSLIQIQNLQNGQQQQQSTYTFRLVKCPLTIELVPHFEDDEFNEYNRRQLSDKNMASTCFIGIDQSVYLRINSGTNKLPKGLKCFMKINQIPMTANTVPSVHYGANVDHSAFDARLINVKLLKPESIDEKIKQGDEEDRDEGLLYFYLDRQLEPFETYQLLLRLRSSYIKSKLIEIQAKNYHNQHQTSHGNYNTEMPNFSSKIGESNIQSRVSQYEFKLSLSWTSWIMDQQNDDYEQLDSAQQSTAYGLQTATCHFTLTDPFHIIPRIYTPSPSSKLLQIRIFSSKWLPLNVELYFRYPQIKIEMDSVQKNAINTDPYLNIPNGIFKPVQIDSCQNLDQDHQYKYKLTGANELNFLWSLSQEDSCLTAKNINLSRMLLQVQFKPRSIFAKAPNGVLSKSMLGPLVNTSYKIAIVYPCQTRYVIRQWIEPLIKNQTGKNSEIIRIGHSCLLRLKIERNFSGPNLGPSLINHPPTNNNIDDELIMYELMCDPQLWSFVASSSITILQNEQENSSDEANSFVELGSICTSTKTSTTSIESRVIKFSGVSSSIFQVSGDHLEDHLVQQSFETAFEVMPLAVGYLPLPTVRISSYRTSTNATETVYGFEVKSGRSTPTSKATLNNNSEVTQQQKTTNTIESLSAILSENLSLSSKNWSKYLSSSSSTANNSSNHRSTSDVNWGFGSQQQHQPDGMVFRNARVEPFEPGQVYNYNYSSQVYVLPSLVGTGGPNVLSDC